MKKSYIVTSIVATAIVYLMVSFIQWDILWITNIGKYKPWVRGEIVIVFLIKEIIVWLVWDSLIKPNQKRTTFTYTNITTNSNV